MVVHTLHVVGLALGLPLCNRPGSWSRTLSVGHAVVLTRGHSPYRDDFVRLGEPEFDRCAVYPQLRLGVFAMLKVPVTCLAFLGIEPDLGQMSLRLPLGKIFE